MMKREITIMMNKLSEKKKLISNYDEQFGLRKNQLMKVKGENKRKR